MLVGTKIKRRMFDTANFRNVNNCSLAYLPLPLHYRYSYVQSALGTRLQQLKHHRILILEKTLFGMTL